jgi:hypothetical protein
MTQQMLERFITGGGGGGGGGASVLYALFHYSYMSAVSAASYTGHSVLVGYSPTILRYHQFVIV